MGILLIAKDNIKRQKGNAFIFFTLVAVAVLMLYVGISVLSNMDKVIDKRNTAVNGADYFLFSASEQKDEIERILAEKQEVTYLETEEGIWTTGTKYYSENETEEEANQISFLFQRKDAQRNLSVIQIIDKGKEWKENSIILPYYMKVGMGYSTGETLHIVSHDKTYSFEIYGFTEDVMFATPTNIPTEKTFISEQYFDKLSEELGGKGYIYRAKLEDNTEQEPFMINTGQTLKKEISDYMTTDQQDLVYDQLKYGTSITANILMAVLTIFAFLLILISLIIVRFNINNSIEMNMRNIGMLKASGYTSGMLVAATVAEFEVIGALGMAGGLLGAKGAADVIGGILSSSMGVQWKMGFEPWSAFISIGVTALLILTVVLFSARRYRKITPLYALRNGIYTHNFRRNHIRLDKTRLPLNTAIGVKPILGNAKKNISISLIVAILVFIGNIAVSLYQNLVLDKEQMTNIIGLEVADIGVPFQQDNKQVIKEKIENMEETAHSIEFATEDMIAEKGEKEISLNCEIYDKTEILSVDNVVEGRRPEYENEIMISTVVAQKLGVSVGEVIYLEMNQGRQDYLVVGMNQGINHLGRNAMITLKGAKRLNEKLATNMFYIYLKEPESVDEVIEILKEELADEKVEIINGKKEQSMSLVSIIDIMKILCQVLATVVFLVIALILMLLVKTQVIREKRQIAIYKALGYTTGQIMQQITMNYIPVFFAGAVGGCIGAFAGVTPAVVLSLSVFGIQNCSMKISFGATLGIVSVVLLWAELVIVLCSARISKITPCEMLQEVS